MECDGAAIQARSRPSGQYTWTCPECKLTYYEREAFEKDVCRTLKNVQGYREFSWVVPVVGLLHIEINVAQSFIKLNWDIFVSLIAHVLGFKSQKTTEFGPSSAKFINNKSVHYQTSPCLVLLILVSPEFSRLS